jgi:general secretion pathway protein E
MNKDAVISLSPEEFPKVPFVIDSISTRFIRENKIIPIELKNNVLKVIMTDPSNREVIEALRVASAADVVIYTGDPAAIEDHISRFYSQETQNINRIIEGIEDENLEFIRDEEEEDIGHLKDLASEAPIIKLVNLFITRAVESRASDIHIEPFKDELKIRYRIDGVLSDVESAPKRLQAAIVSRIKIMAKLNIAERRLPQDGRIRLRVGEREIDLRVSTIPILHGESVVMRILDTESIVINLDALGFLPGVLGAFNQLIKKPNGIILVTGHRQRKTTTLYGPLIDQFPDKKIIPSKTCRISVERHQQIQVNHR